MADSLTLFMCGDVMTGRGIDRILPHPGDPAIFEPFMTSAEGYVELAEEATGPIPRQGGLAYIWGDALKELEHAAPDARIINLETSVTTSGDYWRDKEIHYRMHPENVSCLTAAKIDVCALANNHILDWGYEGLAETVATLKKAGIRSPGAGRNRGEAGRPAIMDCGGKGRVIVFSYGSGTSGIPLEWAATENGPGVNLLEDYSDTTLRRVEKEVRRIQQPGDIVIASIHWGHNWGYDVSRQEREFAHKLVTSAGIDIVHGHSSHHVKGIEVCRGKIILYGCGDFINDYEGIGGYEAFRADLSLMYFVRWDPAAEALLSVWLVPMQMRHFRVQRASKADAAWLKGVLNREGGKFGTRVALDKNAVLTLSWTTRGT